jgi:hypothetical protein
MPKISDSCRYFIFDQIKKKKRANLQLTVVLFIQKIVTKLSKMWVWDPASEIRDLETTCFGSRISASDPQHWPQPFV